MANQWIDVNERLPELFEDVLVHATDSLDLTFEKGTGYHAIDRLVEWNDSGEISFRTDRFFGKVHHWMPLPNLPKKTD